MIGLQKGVGGGGGMWLALASTLSSLTSREGDANGSPHSQCPKSGAQPPIDLTSRDEIILCSS